jgi:hypothetical protein
VANDRVRHSVRRIVAQAQEKVANYNLPLVTFAAAYDELRRACPSGDIHIHLTVEGPGVLPESDARSNIAQLLTRRCNNCYGLLPGEVGCSVHSPGWNWVTPNFGPFCDDCFKEVSHGSAAEVGR